MKHLHKEEKHCEEMFLNFRNMGKRTLDELKEVCKNYGIRIYSRLDLEVPDEELYLSADQYKNAFRKGIRSKQDLMDADNVALAEKFGIKTALYKKLMQIKACEAPK